MSDAAWILFAACLLLLVLNGLCSEAVTRRSKNLDRRSGALDDLGAALDHRSEALSAYQQSLDRRGRALDELQAALEERAHPLLTLVPPARDVQETKQP